MNTDTMLEKGSEDTIEEKKSWYEENIEEPVRDIVRVLRDNGINTVSSCGHKMNIECDYYMDGELYQVHQILYEYLNQKYKDVNFTITTFHEVSEGYIRRSSMKIQFIDKI